MENKDLRKVNLSIEGMHCGSCEVLIERKLKSLPGVDQVNVNHATGKAEVKTSQEIDLGKLNDLIKEHGYSVSFAHDKQGSVHLSPPAKISNTAEDYVEIGAAFLIFISLYLFLKQFNLLPSGFGVSDNISYFFVFGLGLVAALSTCLAVSGGLLLAISARYNEKYPNLTGAQKFKPHIYFNIGRVAGYTLFGGLVGLLGSVLVLSPAVNGILTILVSIIMISLGFQMLGIFPWMKNLTPKMPKFIAHKLYDSTGNHKESTPFLFGAATFFLPCGFTQALQLYVLSKGSFTIGALTMLAFSLGTLPTLVSLGAVSSYSKGDFKRYFTRLAAVLVIIFGVLSINSGLVLTGSAFSFDGLGRNNIVVPELIPGAAASPQVIEMKVVGLDYYPDKFDLKVGVPVEWRIDATKAQGCAQIISVPKLKIMQRMSLSEVTVIKFTPTSAGKISFSCGMGMAGPGTFNVK